MAHDGLNGHEVHAGSGVGGLHGALRRRFERQVIGACRVAQLGRGAQKESPVSAAELPTKSIVVLVEGLVPRRQVLEGAARPSPRGHLTPLISRPQAHRL